MFAGLVMLFAEIMLSWFVSPVIIFKAKISVIEVFVWIISWDLSSSVLQHQFLSEALQWRAQTDPDHVLYMLLNSKVTRIQPHKNWSFSQTVLYWDSSCFGLQGVAVSTATCSQLHKRAEKITAALLERGGINTGDNVVLLYPPGNDVHLRFHSTC